MANRVLLGKRGTSDFGLYVSADGENVISTTNPLSFDSRAVESLIVHSYGQGILIPDATNASGTTLNFTYNGVTYTNDEVSITHNLGYRPAYAVRWCRVTDLDSNGIATKVYNPNQGHYSVSEYDENEDEEITSGQDTGIDVRLATNSPYALSIRNNWLTDDNGDNSVTSITSGMVYAYSYLIFKAENFLNGASL